MSDMRKERKYNSSPKKNIGFYISLVICLGAIAGAAWTTYGSIMDYNRLTDENPVEESRNTAVNDEVSDKPYNKKIVEESSKPESQPEIVSRAETEEESTDMEESTVFEESVRPINTETVDNTPESALATTAEPIDKGEVIKKFSPKNPLHSLTMNDWRTHSGVDISAGEGSPVRAVMEGTVSKIYTDPMLGNVIVIDHKGGYTGRYCGMTDTPVVHEGSNVNAGDTIGYIGKIPSESKDGPHLHLEILLDNTFLDPTLIY